MSIKIPYVSKDTSTLLALSTAIAMLLLASPLLPFNNLLQRAQAQIDVKFQAIPPDLGAWEENPENGGI